MSQALSKKTIKHKIDLFKEETVGVSKTKIMPIVGSQVLREQILKIREQENTPQESATFEKEPDKVS